MGDRQDHANYSLAVISPVTLRILRKRSTFITPKSMPMELSTHRCTNLVHLTDEVVDELLTVTQVTTFDEVLELALAEATSRRRELEGPQEVGSLLEIGADGEDLVDKILDRDDTKLAKLVRNESIVGLAISQHNTTIH
jgi:hypothetical protein